MPSNAEHSSQRDSGAYRGPVQRLRGPHPGAYLSLLLVEGELCVTDISEKVNLSQSAISHQLRALKQMDLIKFRRDGKNVWYSLADDHVKTILQMGLEHVMCD